MIYFTGLISSALVNDGLGFSVLRDSSPTLIRFSSRRKTPNTKAFAPVLGVFICIN